MNEDPKAAVPYGGEGMSDDALMNGMARDLRKVKSECLRLANIVKAVRALHDSDDSISGPCCVTCRSFYPCATLRTINGLQERKQ